MYPFLFAALLVGRSRDRSPAVPLGIFFRGSFWQNHVPWGRLSLWKWVPGISPGVKASGTFGWRPTTLVVPKVEKIRVLNLLGTPSATWACRGLPLPLLLLYPFVIKTMLHCFLLKMFVKTLCTSCVPFGFWGIQFRGLFCVCMSRLWGTFYVQLIAVMNGNYT